VVDQAIPQGDESPLFCGRDLGSGSGCCEGGSADAFASKPAPTRDLGMDSGYVPHHKTLWERGLPAKAVGQAAQMLNVPAPSRASPLPQGISVWIGICASPQNTVGAWLARESGGSGDRDVERAAAFASKPAPTGSGGVHSNRAHHKITVGACLQAIAVGQAAQMLNVPTPSRASPLPQVPRRPGVYSVIFEKLR